MTGAALFHFVFHEIAPESRNGSSSLTPSIQCHLVGDELVKDNLMAACVYDIKIYTRHVLE